MVYTHNVYTYTYIHTYTSPCKHACIHTYHIHILADVFFLSVHEQYRTWRNYVYHPTCLTAGARWGSTCPWPLGGGLGDDGVEEHGRADGGARFVDVVDGLRGGEMLHMKEAGKYLVEFGPGQVGVG
jgi:hypothetical protein